MATLADFYGKHCDFIFIAIFKENQNQIVSTYSLRAKYHYLLCFLKSVIGNQMINFLKYYSKPDGVFHGMKRDIYQ